MSRYAGRYEHVFESTTAGVTIQAPQLDINTVAAGGGSRLFFRSGIFQASPMPKCLVAMQPELGWWRSGARHL